MSRIWVKAMGDLTGLFICLHPEKKKWLPNGDRVVIGACRVEYSYARRHYLLQREHAEGRIRVSERREGMNDNVK